MAELKLYDTMTREKRVFVPADPKRVRIYVCGPTVYNYAHIGNARPVVVFDVLFRLLRRLYGEDAVLYAANVTDVDDKINAKAAEEGVPISVVTDRYLEAYRADMSRLGVLAPTFQPRATEHIGDILEMIGKLVHNNAAYAAEGHVLFDIEKYSDYGQLSRRPLDEMIAGARVEVAPYKKNPADFVLWKPSKPGEPVWDSPWGPGRPGWHIECSAMIEKSLAPLPIDIHGGGIDLVFPHHENEIAQSVCAQHDHREPLANYWMHNGFLDMSGEKMSKSLGNVVLVRDLVTRWPGEVLRWALLSAHYRQPLDWTDSLLTQARTSLNRLYQVLQDADRELAGRAASPEGADAVPDLWQDYLLNDLNTPAAMGELFAAGDRLRAALSARDFAAADRLRAALREAGGLMGFLHADPEAWFRGGANEDLATKVEALIAARAEARVAKDWPAADRIRGELTALNVEVMDGPSGATWRLKTGG
jgi:cysteinyl-tRNA synthetase